MTGPTGSAAKPSQQREELVRSWSGSNVVVGPGAGPGQVAQIMLPVVKSIECLEDSLNRLERESSKLSRRLIGWTVVLAILTVVITGFTILLFFKRG